jgi:nitroreductase
MDALELLLTRSSNGKLGEPAPDSNSLRIAFQAAARAPDHAGLRPWRVRLVRGEARETLGRLMASMLLQQNPAASSEEIERTQSNALRAPLILVVGAIVSPHPKVPQIEQILSAAAAAHSMLLALHACGYAAIWRTGALAYDADVKRAFGFAPSDAIVGFLYAGTAKRDPPAMHRPAPETFVSEWPEPVG